MSERLGAATLERDTLRAAVEAWVDAVDGVRSKPGHGDEGRRANFKARHNCDEKTDKLKPGYWSCNWSW
jgi:hypothetical protein